MWIDYNSQYTSDRQNNNNKLISVRPEGNSPLILFDKSFY